MFIQFGGVVTVISVAVWLWALFDSITTASERVRTLPKAVWVIIVLLILPPIGAICWFVFGRARVATVGSAPRRRATSTAPDDDPEFLLKLREDLRRDKPDPDS